MFWEYHDALFDTQPTWSSMSEADARDHFIMLAADLGLDEAAFTAALDSGEFADLVSASEQEAVALGLPGTPATLVNGQIVAGSGLPFDFDVWAQFIEGEAALAELQDRLYDAPPEVTIDTGARYLAHVTMDSGDSFTIELLPESAPETVNNFVFLANEGWFDGVTFHRVIDGYIAQTGDPSATGRGGPGYFIDNEIDPELSHSEVGMVAMANAGADTNGSQWYITLGDAGQLDGSYTIFGRVIEGLDIATGITPRDPADPAAPDGDRIATITIEEVGR